MICGAQRQGMSWGAHALDWAEVQEPTIRPVSRAVLDELGPWRGSSLLDIGCGAGDFARMATGLGANVSGLDASGPLIQIARTRNPTGEFRVGDMGQLPFTDGRFRFVTAFNSLHFSNHPECTVSEAIRVTRPGGRIVVATWGPPAECDAVTYLLDLGALMPPTPPDPNPRLDPGDLDAFRTLLTAAGLTLSAWRVVPCPWEYADLTTALRGLLSTGPAIQAIDHSGRVPVTDAIAESIAPYRRGDGSYLLLNTCYYLVANTAEEGSAA